MESSIRDIVIFWKLSWGLENDNTLFKNRKHLLISKTWKTIFHNLQKFMTWLGAKKNIKIYWPWPISLIHVSYMSAMFVYWISRINGGSATAKFHCWMMAMMAMSIAINWSYTGIPHIQTHPFINIYIYIYIYQNWIYIYMYIYIYLKILNTITI
jgi:hypothetical protein